MTEPQVDRAKQILREGYKRHAGRSTTEQTQQTVQIIRDALLALEGESEVDNV